VTGNSGKSNVAAWVSEMFAFASFWTTIPPVELTDRGQPRFSIQRAVSSMWMHMSPTMPFEYSLNARHRRGWTSLLYGRIGAGPVHIS
jgi:hypothetical protein